MTQSTTSDAIFPAGILRNLANDRYHPIVFYPAPRPSEYDESIVRHHSKAHHTAGFATRDEAIEFIVAQPTWRPTGAEWEWSGVEVPAIVHWFPLAEGDHG